VTDVANKVVVVKVHRNQAGTKIPFDKLYFFPKSRTDTIPKLFGYALVLPCEKSLLDELTRLIPKEVSAYRHRRDDALLKKSTALDGRSATLAAVQTWWTENILKPYDLTDRVVVVPVLTSKVRKKVNPRYLVTPKWFDAPKAKSRRRRGAVAKPAEPKQALSDFAYLATPKPAPHDKILPICNVCPRQLLQLQGACSPGQAICLKALNFNEIGTGKLHELDPVTGDDRILEDAQEKSHANDDDDEDDAAFADDADGGF